MTSTNTVCETSAQAFVGDVSLTKRRTSRRPSSVASEDDERRMKTAAQLLASDDNREAITADVPFTDSTNEAATEQRRPTKASVVEALMTREGGATLEALCEATGWQPHTCRAFLTGLRKKGRDVIRASDKEGKSIYLLASDRSAASSPEAKQAEAEVN